MPVGTPLVAKFHHLGLPSSSSGFGNISVSLNSLDQRPAVGREHVWQEHGLECRLLFPYDPLAGPPARRLSFSLQHSQQRVGTARLPTGARSRPLGFS
jgi:hypothetical protein